MSSTEISALVSDERALSPGGRESPELPFLPFVAEAQRESCYRVSLMQDDGNIVNAPGVSLVPDDWPIFPSIEAEKSVGTFQVISEKRSESLIVAEPEGDVVFKIIRGVRELESKYYNQFYLQAALYSHAKEHEGAFDVAVPRPYWVAMLTDTDINVSLDRVDGQYVHRVCSVDRVGFNIIVIAMQRIKRYMCFSHAMARGNVNVKEAQAIIKRVIGLLDLYPSYIHRDLHGRNILLTRADNPDNPPKLWIIDFEYACNAVCCSDHHRTFHPDVSKEFDLVKLYSVFHDCEITVGYPVVYPLRTQNLDFLRLLATDRTCYNERVRERIKPFHDDIRACLWSE